MPQAKSDCSQAKLFTLLSDFALFGAVRFQQLNPGLGPVTLDVRDRP